MTAAERHIALGDAVAADILAHWPDVNPLAGDVCERTYGHTFDYENAPPTGRKVYAFVEPTGATEENLARGVNGHRYPVRVLVMERYTGDAADVPTAWVDERLVWLDEQFDRLQDEDRDAATGGASALNRVDPEAAEILFTYDPDMLTELKTFAAAFTVTFAQRDDDEPEVDEGEFALTVGGDWLTIGGESITTGA